MTDAVSGNSERPSGWTPQYQSPEGRARIESRRLVYDCIREGEELFDYDGEVIRALGHMAIGKQATLVDIGCGYPAFMERLVLEGYAEENMIGIEPNSDQFVGLPFWQPLAADPILQELKRRGDYDALQKFYRLQAGTATVRPGGIRLIQGSADFVPLPDNSVDVVGFMSSLYAVDEAKQPGALAEAQRIQKDTGLTVVTTSGEDNKRGIRENEPRIAQLLSAITGREIFAPPKVNAGFTSEKAAAILPRYYRHVYAYHHSQDLVFDDSYDVSILLNSYRSLYGMYVDAQGQGVDKHLFETALLATLGDAINAVLDAGLPIVDHSLRSIFIASQQPKQLPLEYIELTAP